MEFLTIQWPCLVKPWYTGPAQGKQDGAGIGWATTGGPWLQTVSARLLLLSLPPQEGCVGGKLALSGVSESGRVAENTSVILKQRKVKDQSSLLSTIDC